MLDLSLVPDVHEASTVEEGLSDRVADRGDPSRSRSLNAFDPELSATARNLSPSYSAKEPWSEPQSVRAFSNLASKTGCRWPVEELMTPKTSAVAVCCSNASRVQ